MLTSLIYSLVCGGLALAMAIGIWIGFAKYEGRLRKEGKLAEHPGFASVALSMIFTVAVGVVFLAGVYMIVEGVWQFIACPR